MSVFDKSGSDGSEKAVEVAADESKEVQLSTDETLGEAPEQVEEPIQVEKTTVVFVAQSDFDGNINREEFSFQKGVRYEVTRDQAQTWVDADKGYILE